MKKQMTIILNILYYCLIVVVISGWSWDGSAKTPFSSSSEIQGLLDLNPDIKNEAIYLKVRKCENGNITIDIIDADQDLAEQLMKKIPIDKLVLTSHAHVGKVLKNIDATLKEHQGVNEVLFTASGIEIYNESSIKEKSLKSDHEKEKYMQGLIERYSDSLTTPYRALAYLVGKRNEFALQEKYLKKALEVNPNSPEVINDLSWAYFMQGSNLQWASERMEQLLKIFPQFAHGYNTYGGILIKAGDPTKAITYLEEALKLRTEAEQEYRASDNYFLAISYARSGNPVAAKEALDQAIALNPNDAFRKEAEHAVRQN